MSTVLTPAAKEKIVTYCIALRHFSTISRRHHPELPKSPHSDCPTQQTRLLDGEYDRPRLRDTLYSVNTNVRKIKKSAYANSFKDRYHSSAAAKAEAFPRDFDPPLPLPRGRPLPLFDPDRKDDDREGARFPLPGQAKKDNARISNNSDLAS